MFTPQEIRDIRKRLGLSPTQFAAAVGVTENTVRRWEIGDRHPRYETMRRLNDLLAGLNGRNGRKKTPVTS